MSNSEVNTFHQVHLQFIFAVKYRKAQIDKTWKEELHKYITAMIQAKSHKMVQINTMPDHLHMLIGFRPNNNISELIKVVKTESTNWINDQRLTKNKFEWQDSFAVFSYGKSQVPGVIRYIQNQEKHHLKKTFLQEYVEFLKLHELEFDERYIFKSLLD